MRLAVAAALVLVTVIAIVIGISRQQAVRARDQARAEAGQREAAQLLSLGRLRLADHPNAALAYAIASLERSDSDPARRFAVEALWQGPPAFFLTDSRRYRSTFSGVPMDAGSPPEVRPGLALLSRETGERRQLTSTAESTVGFTSDGRRLVTNLIVGAD